MASLSRPASAASENLEQHTAAVRAESAAIASGESPRGPVCTNSTVGPDRDEQSKKEKKQEFSFFLTSDPV